MQPISVVIIAKNEEHIIAETIQSVLLLTDDVVVCDTGSTDDTIKVAQNAGAKIINENWQGYGITKNNANQKAKYNWILQLDADEIVDEQLLQSFFNLDLNNPKILYRVKFQNYIGNKGIKYGEWGTNKRVRLFNKDFVKWTNDAVHESLIYDSSFTFTTLKGKVHHKTMINLKEFETKMEVYGKLRGEKYFEIGKKGAFLKRYFSPIASFIINYFLKLGFLDGKAGFDIARLNMRYTYIKYHTLYTLNCRNKKSI